MTKADRQKVFEKFGGKCAYCGCELGKGWHLDHMEPVVRLYKDERVKVPGNDWQYEWKTKYKGMQYPDRDTVENALPACASCNINKHGDSIEGFRATIQQFIESLNRYSVQYKIAKRYGLLIETKNPVKFYFETVEEKKAIEQREFNESTPF
jgi:5-methylcytosine-specific restriction endonuclease McrA